MNRTTLNLQQLARDIIVHETSGRVSTGAKAPPFAVIEKLRPDLSNLMGKNGFRALLVRALALAAAEVSWLDAVKADAEGALAGLALPHVRFEPAEILRGQTAVLTEVLGLLTALIGPDLTGRLVAEIWPDMRSTISPPGGSEVQSEKAK